MKRTFILLFIATSLLFVNYSCSHSHVEEDLYENESDTRESEDEEKDEEEKNGGIEMEPVDWNNTDIDTNLGGNPQI